MSKEKVNLDYAAPLSSFFQEVGKTLVQQSDYRGIGGHEVKTHGPHGTHSQTSVGMGDKTINFRDCK